MTDTALAETEPAPRHGIGTWVTAALHALVLVALALLWMPAEIQMDDAWISFRYAQNLADGHGLVYNQGENFLGTTAPLYAMVLGGLQAFTGVALPQLVVALHVATILLLGFTIPLLLKRRPADRPTWTTGIAFAWIFLTAPLVGVTVGMETALFAAVGLLMILLCVRGHAILLGILAPLLCLIRPDGALLVVILFASRWLQTRRFPRAAVVAAVVVGMPWLVYSLATYGSPVPHSATAKLAQSQTDLFRQNFLAQLWSVTSRASFAWCPIAAILGVLATLWRRASGPVLVLVWLLLHNGVYALVGVPGYPWYYVPFMAQVSVLALCGASSLLAFAAGPRPRLRAPQTHVAVFALVAVAALAHGWLQNRDRPLLDKPLYPVSNRYLHIGEWIAANTPKDAAVAMIEVGIVGYVSKRPIVDLIGLVSPGVSEHLVDRQHVAFAMQTYRPDYFIRHSPDSALETGLDELARRGFVPVFALGDSTVYLRFDGDEAELAQRITTAMGTREGAVLVPDFPAWLDFERFRALAAERQPSAPVVPASDPAIAWVARLAGDGSFRIEAFDGLVAAAFATADVRDRWQGVETVMAAPRDGLPRWASKGQFSHLALDAVLDGPLRRVRIAMRIEEIFGVGQAVGTLAWTSEFEPAPSMANTMLFPVRETDGVEEFVVELPPKRFGAGDRLTGLRISPMNHAGVFAIDSIRIERY